MLPFKTFHDSLHNMEPSKNKFLLSGAHAEREDPNLLTKTIMIIE